MTGRAFGVGAALTVALDAPGPPHSTIGPWCDLGDLYGILGWLVGDIPTVEQLPATIAADLVVSYRGGTTRYELLR